MRAPWYELQIEFSDDDNGGADTIHHTTPHQLGEHMRHEHGNENYTLVKQIGRRMYARVFAETIEISSRC